MAGQSIIDRDIEMYRIEVEYCESELRRCKPEKEQYWKTRGERAAHVVQALLKLKEIM